MTNGIDITQSEESGGNVKTERQNRIRMTRE
jgi:hypothetical protein